jgi:hypothetical protein
MYSGDWFLGLSQTQKSVSVQSLTSNGIHNFHITCAHPSAVMYALEQLLYHIVWGIIARKSLYVFRQMHFFPPKYFHFFQMNIFLAYINFHSKEFIMTFPCMHSVYSDHTHLSTFLVAPPSIFMTLFIHFISP